MSKNLKIFIFTQSLKNAGAEKQAILLANHLSEKYKVIVINYRKKSVEKKTVKMLNKNVELIHLDGSFLKKLFKLNGILGYHSEYLIFNYLLLPSLIGGFLTLFNKKGISIGGIRNAYLVNYKVPFYWLSTNCLNYKTIFNNFTGFEKYTKLGFSSNKSLVIHNCITVKEINKNYSNSCVKILSVARFSLAKDYFTALCSIKALINMNYNIHYTMVGWGTMKSQIESFILELGIKDKVSIVDNPQILSKFFLKSDIFLQTSLYEGLSNSILEAMSYKLPLVISNVGDNHLLVKNNFNGYLVEPKDVNGFRDSLMMLIDNPENISEFGKNSFNLVSKNFSEKIFKNKYLDFIKNIENECISTRS